MTALRHSVGQGGRNERNDVRRVQALLNRHLPGRRPALKIDGIVGPRTLAAIRHVQTHIVKLRPPDGRVDPHGPTLRVLDAAPHLVEAGPASAPRPTATPRTGQSRDAAPIRPTPAPPAVTPSRDVIAWGAKVSPGFKRKVLEIAERLQISADFLMSCMAFESGETFSPSIRNAAGSGAVGLIQFMPSTARALHTTTTALAAMSAEAQLSFVERYFKPYKGRVRTIEDIYMTILFPKAIGKPAEYTLFSKGTTAYRQNRGLDADQDAKVSKFEAAAAVRAKYRKGLKPGYIG